MLVFWAKGYEATQIADLTHAMGLNPPSFYAAFQSKESVFRESVQLYLATVGSGSMAALKRKKSARNAIWSMLTESIDTALSSPSSCGCMVALGVIDPPPGAGDLRKDMQILRNGTIENIRLRLEQGIASGELNGSANVPQLSRYFAMIIQGLSVQARDGASRQELRACASAAMTALDAAVVQN